MPHDTDLYTAATVAAIDRAASAGGIPSYTLMRRAGAGLLRCLQQHYAEARTIAVFCGAGNNAGDGYVVARLARQHGYQVRLYSLVDVAGLQGDAAIARDHWLETGEILDLASVELDSVDVIIDALLGIGLDRDVTEDWKRCVDIINDSGLPVIAADIPSGLHADSGRVLGAAVRARHCLSFVAHKQGLFTADASEYRGQLELDRLEVPDECYESAPVSARLLTASECELPRRANNSHKSDHGRVLVIGGDHGMAGAVALAAKAALVAGAGLVRVVTRPQHVAVVTGLCPEAMVTASEDGELPDSAATAVDHVLIGCGLGQGSWSRRLLSEVRALNTPVTYDADALNLVAAQQLAIDNAVAITPHPGEAARLLGCSTEQIQSQRYDSARRLRESAACCVILKGAGTIIAGDERLSVCDLGSAAMATAGMGDVLAGITAAFIAQGMEHQAACERAVYVHAGAAMLAASGRSRGVLASNVIEVLPECLCET